MSRYSTRLRSLERRIVPGACPQCAGCRVDFVTVAPGQAVPRQVCEACGTPHKLIVVEIDTEQPEPATEDLTPARERPSKAVIRRRRYCGTN